MALQNFHDTNKRNAFFFKFDISTWSTELERKKKKHSPSIFYSLDCCPVGCRDQGWAELNPRAVNFSILPHGLQGLKQGELFKLISQAVNCVLEGTGAARTWSSAHMDVHIEGSNVMKRYVMKYLYLNGFSNAFHLEDLPPTIYVFRFIWKSNKEKKKLYLFVHPPQAIWNNWLS